jgi:hypothetical protein
MKRIGIIEMISETGLKRSRIRAIGETKSGWGAGSEIESADKGTASAINDIRRKMFFLCNNS